jgi:hypothetical protein
MYILPLSYLPASLFLGRFNFFAKQKFIISLLFLYRYTNYFPFEILTCLDSQRS